MEEEFLVRDLKSATLGFNSKHSLRQSKQNNLIKNPNVNFFRGPRTHSMPNWIRILFLKYLPIFLFMRRPKKTRLRWMMEIPGTSRKIPPGPPPNVMNSSGAGLMGASTMPDGGPGLHGLSPPGYPQVSTQRVSILDALGANICKLTQFHL